MVGCFGLTEPDAGSDPGGMKTRAKKVDGGYVLNGSKMWISNSPIADVAVVWAKTRRRRAFAASSWSAACKGFSTPKIEGKISLRASVTGEIVLDDVVVPEDNLLPERHGPRRARSAASTRRATASPGAPWARRRICWHRARQYMLDRKQFGRPLAANQLIQKKLADMQTEIALGLQGAGARPR